MNSGFLLKNSKNSGFLKPMIVNERNSSIGSSAIHPHSKFLRLFKQLKTWNGMRSSFASTIQVFANLF